MNKNLGEKMVTVNEIANKLVSEFIGKDYLDYRTEISNHDIMYDKKLFSIIDNYGQNKFENLVIKKLEERA
tara:strand:- start:282 stop:494 length:213 start_codon:yes stop_codon:yes gene_type:complete